MKPQYIPQYTSTIAQQWARGGSTSHSKCVGRGSFLLGRVRSLRKTEAKIILACGAGKGGLNGEGGGVQGRSRLMDRGFWVGHAVGLGGTKRRNLVGKGYTCRSRALPY